MKELIFRTRAQSNPNGKMKVYFCHHPEDFDDHFSRICGDILSVSDCAVCYYGGEGEMPELATQEQNLSHMRLLVMPVTTRLLTEPSHAFSYEVPLARKYKIPILPLMMEEGLEELFKSRLGQMHFLCPDAADETAIPYREKLQKYMESRFVSDATAQRIRKAFDAYIFLSYRKKDRESAQELMKMIHKIDFCRDFAIWYDEFLTPGEDFSEAIRKAITDSQFFALTVTPNLLEDGNYVKEEEFPLAKTLKKPILPVEFADTDRAELKDIYDIDDPVCSKKPPQLAERLLREIEKLAKEKKLKNNKKGPDHSYLMGLAYLNGIDVERDPEKAEALITEAAEASIYDAVAKLARMYLDGDGVERSDEKGLFWMERQVKLSEEAYQRKKDEDSATQYYYDLWLFSAVLIDRLQPDRALEVCRRMEDLTGELKSFQKSSFMILCQLHCQQMLSKIFYTQHRKRDNKKACKTALKLAEELVKEDPSEHPRVLLAECRYALAEACIDLVQLGQAKWHYRKALGLWETIVEENATQKNLLALADCCDSFGDLSPYRAKKYFQKAFEIRKALAKEQEDSTVMSSLAESYLNLAMLESRLGDKEIARDYCEEAVSLREQVCQKDLFLGHRETLAATYYRCGIYLEDVAMLEKAVALNNELLTQHPDIWYLQGRKKKMEADLAKLKAKKKRIGQ